MGRKTVLTMGDGHHGRVKLLSAAGSKTVFLLFPSGEWRVMCYQKHLETTTT